MYVVYVPQGYVALVYVGGRLHDVLEAGVGLAARGAEVQYVDLQRAPWTWTAARAAAVPEDWDAVYE